METSYFYENNLEAVENVFLNKFDANSFQNGDGRSWFSAAVVAGSLEMIALFLSNGANGSIQDQTDEGYTPMINLLRDDWLRRNRPSEVTDKIRWLIEHRVDVEARDRLGETALFHAIEMQNTEVIALLLEHGANSSAPNHTQMTPLHYLGAYAREWSTSGAYASMGRLEEPSIGIRNKYEQYLRVAEMLLQKGANLDAADDNGYVPIHLACNHAQWEFVNLLIQYGDDISKPSPKTGRTALHFGFVSNKEHVVRAVLEYYRRFSLNVNRRDNDSLAPVHWAAAKGSLENFVELVRIGGDLDMKTEQDLGDTVKAGMNALDLAVALQNDEVANWIRANHT